MTRCKTRLDTRETGRGELATRDFAPSVVLSVLVSTVRKWYSARGQPEMSTPERGSSALGAGGLVFGGAFNSPSSSRFVQGATAGRQDAPPPLRRPRDRPFAVRDRVPRPGLVRPSFGAISEASHLWNASDADTSTLGLRAAGPRAMNAPRPLELARADHDVNGHGIPRTGGSESALGASSAAGRSRPMAEDATPSMARNPMGGTNDDGGASVLREELQANSSGLLGHMPFLFDAPGLARPSIQPSDGTVRGRQHGRRSRASATAGDGLAFDAHRLPAVAEHQASTVSLPPYSTLP